MSAAEAEEKQQEKEEEAVRCGELLFCGATAWDAIGWINEVADGNLVSPTRLRPLIGINICFVASGRASFHCAALDVYGRCYTWGRNELDIYDGKASVEAYEELQSNTTTSKTAKRGSESTPAKSGKREDPESLLELRFSSWDLYYVLVWSCICIVSYHPFYDL